MFKYHTYYIDGLVNFLSTLENRKKRRKIIKTRKIERKNEGKIDDSNYHKNIVGNFFFFLSQAHTLSLSLER